MTRSTMTLDHQCLTQSAVLGLLELEYPQASTMITTPTAATIGSVFNTVHGLHGCEQCWGVIDELRKRFTGHSMTSTNPFATLFLTLITRQARRASHRIALETVREAPFGIYRLLLEEIADHLPMNSAEDSQRALLLFELLLESIKDSSTAWHDLRSRASAVLALLWSCQGKAKRAEEYLRQAEHHRRRGTGDRELHATILAIEGESLHGDRPSEGTALLRRALKLVDDLPLRKMELLYQLAHLHICDQELEEAWRYLLSAEDLADDHARYFLGPIWQRMLLVETVLVIHGDEQRHTLYRCMGHYHARCLGLEETTRETAPPLELWRLQDSLPHHQVAQGRFTSLCLAWAAGHDIPASDWQGVKVLLAGSPHGQEFFDVFYQQLTEIWCCYPDGRLAFDFLDPLINILDRIRPSV